MRLHLLAFAILLFGTHLQGQILGTYPDQFSSYFSNQSLVNPAFIPQNGVSEAIFQSKLRRGLYKDITTIAATLQKTFNSKGRNWHSGRLIFMNEKEGSYISIPRMYGNYGLRIRIKEEAAILAGISIGAVNPNFSTPTKSVNAILVDGSLGIMYQYKTSSFGISSNQIFNNYSDAAWSIVLKRFYNAHFDSRFSISHQLELNARFLYSYFTDLPSQANASFSVILKEVLEAGLGYKTRQGTFVYFSATAFKDSDHPIKISALYNSLLFSNQNAMAESVELSLAYCY